MRCGDFSPDTCCLTLQLKVPAITLRRKSARRRIVHLIRYVQAFPSALEIKKRSSNENHCSTKTKMNSKNTKKVRLLYMAQRIGIPIDDHLIS